VYEEEAVGGKMILRRAIGEEPAGGENDVGKVRREKRKMRKGGRGWRRGRKEGGEGEEEGEYREGKRRMRK
jgi:hypothetical protein